MSKDKRYSTLQKLFAIQEVDSFRSMFDIVPKSVMARDLGMNNVRFSKLMDNVDRFVIKDVNRIAKLIGVNEEDFMAFVMKQYMSDKRKRK